MELLNHHYGSQTADQLTNRPYEILAWRFRQGVIVDVMKACTMKTISLVEHLHLVNVTFAA